MQNINQWTDYFICSLQYDAFSNPALKRNYEIASEKLGATRQHLEETCASFRELEDRLAEQESKFQAQSNNLANGKNFELYNKLV